MRYEDFVLQLGPESSQGIDVKAACALAGEARGRLSFSLAPETLAAGLLRAVHGRTLAEDPAAGRNISPATAGTTTGAPAISARVLGASLFRAVFRGPVRNLLDQSLGHLRGEERYGLRVRLQLDLADEIQLDLHALPWELLYKPDTGDFLGLSRRTPIVRYLELPRAVPPVTMPEVLRVLALAPQPPGQPALDLHSERRNLEILEGSVAGLEVDFPEAATLGALRRSLLERETHVLHIMGHGDFDPRTGEGILYLESGEGRAEAVTAEALVAVVSDFPKLRLVVLNACSTARAGGSLGVNPFLGLAPALMRAGLPAVLAMQRPISDGAAITFSQALYARLIAGDPLDAAVAEGRQSIHSMAPRSMEWAVPALLMRAPDGTIFTPAEAQLPPASHSRSRGLDHLLAGNYEDAVRELRAERAAAPERGLPAVALGVALGRGRRLGQLPFQTAKEMHWLFAVALSSSETQDISAAALLALKLDYFSANSVREPAPPLEEVIDILSSASWNALAARLLRHLSFGNATRQTLVRSGFPDRRRRTS